jgi:hypothetical protein
VAQPAPELRFAMRCLRCLITRWNAHCGSKQSRRLDTVSSRTDWKGVDLISTMPCMPVKSSTTLAPENVEQASGKSYTALLC